MFHARLPMQRHLDRRTIGEAFQRIDPATGAIQSVHPTAPRPVILAGYQVPCADLASESGQEMPVDVSMVRTEADCLVIWTETGNRAPLQLRLTWSDAEIAVSRLKQRQVSLAILAFGLLAALATNLLAFRVIIGRPLQEMIARIDIARQEAEHRALHDELTGLPNRRQLERRLATIREGLPRQTIFALQIDLDGFKTTNDTLGHAAGDRVLRLVADGIRGALGPGDFAARMGGDEFLVIPRPGSDEAAVERLAKTLVAALTLSVEFGEAVARIGASIGLAATSLDDPRAAERLLMDADIALYRAKQEGRGRVVTFSPMLRADMEARLTLNDELQTALETGEISVVYQPQFEGGSHRLVALEALVRWHHPSRGLLAPSDFLPMIEESSLIERIDAHVLDVALADIARWERAGRAPPPVSLNVSARRLSDTALLPGLAARSIPPGRITFEVLETMFLDQLSDGLRWNLDELAELGVAVELGDFGSERASVVSLLSLRPTRIKIAGRIVEACLAPGGETELLVALVALGRALDVGLTAEGIGSEQMLERVAGLGFDRLQGYALCPPAEAACVPAIPDAAARASA